jgi:hypothetical protein
VVYVYERQRLVSMSKHFDRGYADKLADMLWKKYTEIFKRYSAKFYESNQIKLELDISKSEVFQNNFRDRYEHVMINYMSEDVTSLDRHKVASIAIIEFVLSEVLKYDEPKLETNEIFMPKYYLAAQTGLAFMQYWFNNLLKARGIEPIEEWYWPLPLSCPDKPYFCVFSRRLYYIDHSIMSDNGRYAKTFNEIELAEKLFLFEYLTILKKGLDPVDLLDDRNKEI